MSIADEGPLDRSTRALYDTLRRVSQHLLSRSASEATSLQATELVHECYLRFSKAAKAEDLGHDEFLALAATVLRRLLVDEHRRARTLRRGEGWHRITLHDTSAVCEDQDFDLLALDDALDRLTRVDARQARVVELRFFTGLSESEVARVLGLSRRTVSNEWAMARAWLRRELSEARN